MMSAAEITRTFEEAGATSREQQEVRFVLAPLYGWGYIVRKCTAVLDVHIPLGVVIEAIDPAIIRGRNIEIAYLEGSEGRARALAALVKRSEPRGAFYITPRGDWVQLVDGHWKVLVRMPNGK